MDANSGIGIAEKRLNIIRPQSPQLVECAERSNYREGLGIVAREQFAQGRDCRIFLSLDKQPSRRLPPPEERVGAFADKRFHIESAHVASRCARCVLMSEPVNAPVIVSGVDAVLLLKVS